MCCLGEDGETVQEKPEGEDGAPAPEGETTDGEPAKEGEEGDQPTPAPEGETEVSKTPVPQVNTHKRNRIYSYSSPCSRPFTLMLA